MTLFSGQQESQQVVLLFGAFTPLNWRPLSQSNWTAPSVGRGVVKQTHLSSERCFLGEGGLATL